MAYALRSLRVLRPSAVAVRYLRPAVLRRTASSRSEEVREGEEAGEAKSQDGR